jgi:outer membrane cobalamin receptor
MKKIAQTTLWLAALATSLAAATADSTAHSDSTFVMHHMQLDSNATRGSSYGSFADVLFEYPGIFHYDRGSVGQQALLSLYGGSGRHTTLYMDGLLLNDPITGLADFSLIPVEAIGGGTIQGQEIELESRDIAAAPLRSRVAYRTGMNGYDDIDARLGARFSSRTILNAGGVLRNYGGTTTANAKYRAQTINLVWRRQWSKQWQVSYRLLKNQLDRDIPLPVALAWWPALQQPHEKLDRYDHGLVVEKDQRLRFSWQYTDLHQEWYGYKHSVVDQTMNAGRSILRVLWQGMWKKARWQTDGAWIFTYADGRDWEKKIYKNDLQFRVQLQSTSHVKWFWRLAVQADKREDYALQVLPQAEAGRLLVHGWRIKLWQSSSLYTAGLAGRYGKGPLVWGQSGLKAERSDNIHLALEQQHNSGSLFFSSGLWLQHQPIWSIYDPSVILQTSLPYFQNGESHRIWTTDTGIEQNLTHAFSFYLKASYRHGDELALASEPKYWARGYLQYHKIFFGGDLNTTLRLGATLLGERHASALPYVDKSGAQSVLPSCWVPYGHAMFIIKDVTLFFVMQNLLATDYQVMNGYPMPKRQFRWGLVWNFFD